MIRTAQKRNELQVIAQQIEQCALCRVKKIGKAVPGEGSVDARVIFVGEAPGKTEAETGRPFVGRSGKLLRKMIVDIGLKEEDVFITSAVKYLPEHVTPKSAEIEHGRKHLFKQLEVINPDIVVLLGRFAALSVLGINLAIAKEHGKIVEKDGRRYLIAYHPAAVLYSQAAKGKLEEDFECLKNILKTL
jgi:DNA polymerase